MSKNEDNKPRFDASKFKMKSMDNTQAPDQEAT
jgi:hypothetical protein